jgi:1-acyl-sn-glycerol-3-phosphate acyltransferase
MSTLAKFLFFQLVVRPLILIVLGLNVRHRERLPRQGPAILAANHNSHLDTVVLMTLFPWRLLRRVRPVAAADYFLRNRLIAWFALRIIGIVPVDRSGGTPKERVLSGVDEALARGDIVLIFPEGSRGEPEKPQQFKSGLYHLGKAHPEVPVIPVFLHGLGKALPKGEALLVPFFCDVFVGEPLRCTDERDAFMQRFSARMNDLAAEGKFEPWE